MDLELAGRVAVVTGANKGIGLATTKALLSRSLAQEFGPRGIRVNCVSPGQVGTDLWLGADGVAQTVAKATGVDADAVRAQAAAAIDPGGGRDADRVPGLGAHRERHRRQLRDRRRPDQDDLRDKEIKGEASGGWSRSARLRAIADDTARGFRQCWP